jgi:hypothetical protein
VFSFWATVAAFDWWTRKVPDIIRIPNDTVVSLSAFIPTDPTKAKPSDGTAFASTVVVPKRVGSILRVYIRVYASAPDNNIVVVAAFRNSQDSPLWLDHRISFDNKRVKIAGTFNLQALEPRAIELTFRIGPAYKGSIVLNGPAGIQTSDSEGSVVEITQGE